MKCFIGKSTRNLKKITEQRFSIKTTLLCNTRNITEKNRNLYRIISFTYLNELQVLNEFLKGFFVIPTYVDNIGTFYAALRLENLIQGLYK